MIPNVASEQPLPLSGLRVWMPLPDEGFEPSEASVSWKKLRDAGAEVVIATEHGGTPPRADLLRFAPVLGSLNTTEEVLGIYRELQASPEFQKPVSWKTLDPLAFDGLLLPGGHAPGMRQFLGSAELQAKVVQFWKTARPVAAICHGPVVLARAIDPETGRSVLHGRRSASLPKYLERLAYLMTFWRVGRHFRTYEAYVEDEVREALGPSGEYARGPVELGHRGGEQDRRGAWVFEDGNYVSARWPGDAFSFGERFVEKLAASARAQRADLRRAGAA